jgi:hypothetical protein
MVAVELNGLHRWATKTQQAQTLVILSKPGKEPRKSFP